MNCEDICPFNHLFKVECHNLLKINEKYERLNIISPLNIGYFSNTYLVDLNGCKVMKYIDLNIKFFNDNESRLNENDKIKSIIYNLDQEICNQNKASEISPKIYIYWKCKIEQKAVIIMEYIQGITLSKYNPPNEDYLTVYLKGIRNILFLNLELGILHGDLHLENIIVSRKKLYFIDFGESEKYNNSYSDLISFTIEYILTFNDPTTREFVQNNNLDREEGWSYILSAFQNINEILDYLSLQYIKG